MERAPLVFIGSSTEGLPIAEAIRKDIESRGGVIVKLWSQGLFRLGSSIPAKLIETAATFDFAVLVFSPDDVVLSRRVTTVAPRDNLVFELGLFAGQLGPERTFVVVHQPEQPKLPSDFSGVIYATYTMTKDDRNKDLPEIHDAVARIMDAVERWGKLRHPRLEPTLASIIQNHRQAFRVEHPVFQQYLENWCDLEQEDSKAWGEGVMRIGLDYADVLSRLYVTARRSIFSTCIRETRHIWGDFLGRLLLRTQSDNKKAGSTRVFIYGDEEQISPEDIRIMQLHKQYGIEVRIHRSVAANADIRDDWTMIDEGEAIGITQSVHANRIEAYWYFGGTAKAAQYRLLRDRLLHLSEPLDDWLSKRSATGQLAG